MGDKLNYLIEALEPRLLLSTSGLMKPDAFLVVRHITQPNAVEEYKLKWNALISRRQGIAMKNLTG